MTDTFYGHKVKCPHCGSIRSDKLKEPCELCGSRQMPFVGYTYGVERNWILIVAMAAFAICLLAAIAGAVFVVIQVMMMGT